MILLSKRQDEVLRLKATGMLDKQVAAELGLSCETVKTRLARIRAKFQAKGDLCVVVLRAERLGLLQGVEV